MKVPVSASRKGNDQVGALLLPAIHQELSKSTAYSFRRDEPVSDAPEKKGLEFFIELATADAATNRNMEALPLYPSSSRAWDFQTAGQSPMPGTTRS
jgi:hypothetical protein